MNWRALLPGLLLCVHASVGSAAQWVPLVEASRLEFVATYQGQQVRGVFHRFEVHLALNPEKPPENTLDVSVSLQSADMGSADVNRAIADRDWFDVLRFPLAHFKSTEFAKDAADRYVAKGVLSLKGMQRTVAVPFSWQDSGKTAHLEGQLSLKRTDFGIGTGDWATGDTIGLDVAIQFSLELQRVR